MKHLLLPTALVAFVAGSAAPASTQDAASQLVGVWKLQKFDSCKAGTDECRAFYGEKPAGYMVFTRSGVFLSQGYAEKRVVPKTPDPTDEERVSLHKSMFAWGGRYKVEDDKVVVTVEISWNQAWTGTVRPGFKASVQGKTLTITSSPFKSTVDGTMVTTKLSLERVE
jgi:hypothetical protein